MLAVAGRADRIPGARPGADGHRAEHVRGEDWLGWQADHASRRPTSGLVSWWQSTAVRTGSEDGGNLGPDVRVAGGARKVRRRREPDSSPSKKPMLARLPPPTWPESLISS
jgi:hypothetical protein